MLTLEGKENEIVTELAVHIVDRYILMHECDEGYYYSILDEQYHLLDGGVYDNPDITIQRAMDMVLSLIHISGEQGSIYQTFQNLKRDP